MAGIRQRMEQHVRRPTAVLLSGLEETACKEARRCGGMAGAVGSKPEGGRAVAVAGAELSFPAGLFNLRGDDIPYNPVFYSYTLLTNTTIRWAAHHCGHRAWRGLTTHPPSSLPFLSQPPWDLPLSPVAPYPQSDSILPFPAPLTVLLSHTSFPIHPPAPCPLQGTAHSLSSQPEFLPFPAQHPLTAPQVPPLCWRGRSWGDQRQQVIATPVPAPSRSLHSLFVEQSRLSVEARQSLRSGCPGPLCVELQEYGQVSAHLRRYAQGNVTVWLGTEYTTYGLYAIIPQVGTEPAHGACGSCRLGDGPVSPRCGRTWRLRGQVAVSPSACRHRRSCWRRVTRP